MIRFLALNVQEKFGGHHDGATPDYRAFLYYSENDVEQEIRGYGANPALAAQDAWDRYIEFLKDVKEST